MANNTYSQENQLVNYKIVSYNVENYFDTKDDSLTDDAEFLPQGNHHWNYTKYKTKQVHIGKVIAAISGWEAPAIVGLVEVESKKALVDLIRYSGLRTFNYQFVHYESPDARGIDVAMLYQPRLFDIIYSRPIRIHFPEHPDVKTRDLLMVTGKVPTGDTLTVFVCHFPSRLEGELESEDRRMYVAQVIRHEVDSLIDVYTKPNIVIMGDFNDYPTNKSIAQVLGASMPTENPEPDKLYNLSLPLHLAGKGTYKHGNEWGMLDQFIVSGNLLDAGNAFFTHADDTHVLDAKFLLERDETNLGIKPFRTYSGMKYNGGYSDHLPIYVDFWFKPQQKDEIFN